MSINCSFQNEVIRVNLENESLKDKIFELKKVIEKWTCNKVTLDQLLSEQVPGNIVKALGAPETTFDFEADCDNQEPLPALPKLIGAEPSGTSNSLISLADLTINMVELTLNIATFKKSKQSSSKVPQSYVIKKKAEPKLPATQASCSDKNVDSSTEQLLLTLMEEDYLKRSVWYLDSGCSRHMTGVKQYLYRYSKESGPKVIDATPIVDHLGKFDEKADDGFFLGYSLVAKAFRVFNIVRQEIDETFHVTFSEYDEAISQNAVLRCESAGEIRIYLLRSHITSEPITPSESTTPMVPLTIQEPLVFSNEDDV
ncbi:hypothetical protein Tco_0389503 [Tanacetum coccineum]